MEAANELAEALLTAKSGTPRAAFESTLIECNEAITTETGIEYGEVCETESDCC